MPDFIAVDGEADDAGRYILLSDSTGRTLYEPAGISTDQAFQFLLNLAGKGRVIVCYGLNYDANQWLRDLRRGELERLAQDGSTVHQFKYRVEWLPSKYIRIKEAKSRRSIQVCEVFGFFQTSFVNALKAWDMEPPAEIEAMKAKRGTFTHAQLQRVTDYCLEECRLLVKLMDALASSCADAGIIPRTWIGAGSLAAQLLRQNGVKAHHKHDANIAERDIVENAILGSYYGGRVEMLAQGVFPQVHTRDIRSAYPYAATFLPSLDDAQVCRVRRFEHGYKHAIWRVRWNEPPGRQLMPFPCRLPDHSIAYPRAGTGWYHHIEVENAIGLGYDIEVLEGVILSTTDMTPFDWIPDLFKRRAALKEAGDPAEKAIKLALNSCYGKLAQGYGFGGKPPFQSYWWAGEITARTRAMVLWEAHLSKGIIMISTDGVFSITPPRRGKANGLGSWEPGSIDSFFVGQPGVYDGEGEDGRRVRKSRGFFAKEVDYGELRALYQERGPEAVYHYDSRRFIGLKVALHRRDFGVWRTWTRERRAINLWPERKTFLPGAQAADPYPEGVMPLHPIAGPIDSMPYEPKQALYDVPDDHELENMVADDQPHMESML